MLKYAAEDFWNRIPEGRKRSFGRLDERMRGIEPDPGHRDDDQQVSRSATTDHAIQTYMTARDPEEQSGALDEVVRGWRADNASAGLSVLAHRPLPAGFAEDIARQIGGLTAPDRQRALSEVLGKSEPGVKLHVVQQLSNLLRTGASAQDVVETGRDERSASAGHAARNAGRSGRPFALMGGDEGWDGPPPSKPRTTRPFAATNRSPTNPPPPLPRPHPDSEKRALCQKVRDDHAGIRQAINYYERLTGAAETKLNSLTTKGNALRRDREAAEADLSEARGRPTEPGDQVWICPSDPTQKQVPGRRRKRMTEDERQEMVIEGLCETSGPIITDRAKQDWRNRLEGARARDIARLEAELRSIDQQLSDVNASIGPAQREIEEAEYSRRSLVAAWVRVKNEYEASGCGDSRGLWSY
jgi:hypothetical protein